MRLSRALRKVRGEGAATAVERGGSRIVSDILLYLIGVPFILSGLLSSLEVVPRSLLFVTGIAIIGIGVYAHRIGGTGEER